MLYNGIISINNNSLIHLVWEEKMKKICILGIAGSGKSTLNKELSRILGIKTIHLDYYYWNPNWEPTPKEEWLEINKKLVSEESWIMDGNYRSTLDMRIQSADLIIFLDFPRFLAYYRVIKRRIIYHNRTRPDIGEGCNEKIDLEFLMWIWNFKKTNRPSILNRINNYGKTDKLIVLKSPRKIKEFLNRLEKNKCQELI